MSEREKSEIALQLYTVRDFSKTPRDIAETLGKTKAIGYNHVQIAALGPIDPKELKKIADDKGLGLCSSHTDVGRLRNKLDTVIEEHNIWQCRHITIPALPEKYRNADGYTRFAKEASEIGRKLAEAGITLSYHNHWWELEEFDGRTGLDILYTQSDPAALAAEIDTCWMAFGGHDPVVWIRKLKGRLPLIHLKDKILPSEEVSGTLPVGEGSLKWDEIIPACRDAGTEWYIVEQDDCVGDPFDCVARSYRFLTGLGLS